MWQEIFLSDRLARKRKGERVSGYDRNPVFATGLMPIMRRTRPFGLLYFIAKELWNCVKLLSRLFLFFLKRIISPPRRSPAGTQLVLVLTGENLDDTLANSFLVT